METPTPENSSDSAIKKLYADLKEIEGKISQLYRIATELHEKKRQNLLVIRGSSDYDQVLSSLKSLDNILKRELRVIRYCQYGIHETRAILYRSRDISFGPISNTSRIKYFIRKKLPLIRKTSNTEKFKEKYISNLYEAMDLQVSEYKSKSSEIQDILERQGLELAKMLEGMDGGKTVVWNLRESDSFKEFLRLLKLQEETVNSIQKSSRKMDIMKYFYGANDFFERNKKASAIQGAMAVLPISTTMQVTGGALFGIEYVFLFWGLAQLIKWSPAVSVMVKRKLIERI